MFSRLPLPLKILLWFFANLGLLVIVCVLLFSAQSHFNFDWLFADSARQRVDAMRELLVNDLSTQPPDDWEDVLDRFAEAYHVRFALYDQAGRHLLGPANDLPAEVRTQMRLWPNAPAKKDPSSAVGPRRQPQKALVSTKSPRRYWLLFTAQVDNPQVASTMYLDVVGESPNAGMGGLIIDSAPWVRLAIGTVIFSVLFWLPMLRGVTRTIGQVTHAARQIAEGHFETRVATRRRDELGVLAAAVNQMAVRLDGLLRGQKRFLGDVAHELCSPLARLQLTLGIIEQRTADDSQKRYVQTALDKAAQISGLVDQLLAFSRASLGGAGVNVQTIDVRAAAEAARAHEDTSDAVVSSVHLAIPAGLNARADFQLLVRAISNLLRNAAQYSPGNAEIAVSAERVEPSIAIHVTDHGPGVPEDELPKIFDAFYRVDTSRTRETGGVGLGLSIVKMCVESCGGTVTARNRSGGGLEVTLLLPAAPPGEIALLSPAAGASASLPSSAA